MEKEIIAAIAGALASLGGAIAYGAKKWVDVQHMRATHDMGIQKARFSHEQSISEKLLQRNNDSAQKIEANTHALKDLELSVQSLTALLQADGIVKKIDNIVQSCSRIEERLDK